MVKQIFVSASLILTLFGGVVLAQAIENSYPDLGEQEQLELAKSEQIKADKTKLPQLTKQFVQALLTIDLETPLESDEARNLNRLFTKISSTIIGLEESIGLEYTLPYRTEIQNAIENHMKRPGAMEAMISVNINAYSTYLTETLIIQADEQEMIASIN